MQKAARIALAGCILFLSGCADSEASHYRKDHKAFLRELIHCENNYAAEHDTAACRAALKVNAELFPE